MIDADMPVNERPRKYQPRPADPGIHFDGDTPDEAASREAAWQRYVEQVNGG